MENKGMVVSESQDYLLEVGQSRETDIICYLIINKKTKVVEVETSILPQALKFLTDLQAGLDAMSASKKVELEKEGTDPSNDDNRGNVISITDKGGTE